MRRRLHAPRPTVLIALLAAVVVLGGGFLVVRQSSLVEVREVQVTGLTGPEAADITRRLTEAARSMTTLAVDRAALDEVGSRYAVVDGITAEADPPHGLRIQVRERPPVAVIGAGAGRTLVAGDGRLLRGAARRELPTVPTEVPLDGSRVTDRRALAAIRVLAAAPPPLRARVDRATSGRDGVVLELGDGPDLRFGRGDRLVAKWAAAARVLADESSRGAAYLDVRLPERPAAGGLEDPATQADPGALADPLTTPDPQAAVEVP